MATDLRGYTEQEVLNKVLNTSSDSIKVDIVSGAEYAEDAAHTTADVGQFVLGVRNDTLAALGGTEGDYVPFQMRADGALYVEIATGGSASAVYVDDADWTDSTSSHMLVGGIYQSSPQSITDGDTGPLQVNANGNLIVDLSATDNAVLDAIAASLSVLDDWDDSNYANVNLNVAGSDIAANAGTMSATTPRVTIATDDTHFGAVGAAADVDGVVHGQLRYIGAGLDTLETTLSNIETAVQIIDDWDDSNYANVNINIAGTDVDGNSGNKSAQSQRVVIATDDVNVSAIKTAVELIDDTVAVLGTATYSETSTKGNVVGVVRNDTLAALAGTDNEIAPLQVNALGALYTEISSTPTTSATISSQSRSATSYAALTGSNMTTDTHGIFSYVIQITGTDNCTLKVQGSNDNSNWVDDDMEEVTIATSASGLISGTTFFQYIRLQFKSSNTNGTTVNGQGYAK